MIALTIEDIKAFTKALLIDDIFHSMLCCKITIHHNVDFFIDGHYNMDFFDNEEREEKKEQQYATWEELKPIAFQIIKGTHLPQSFQIVLALPPSAIVSFIEHSKTTIRKEQVDGLYINVHYHDGQLQLTTGSSYSLFTMDKNLDQYLDTWLKKKIASLNIAFHE